MVRGQESPETGAVNREKDYWTAYFEKHPGTTLYFCGSEVRSVFIPKETA